MFRVSGFEGLGVWVLGSCLSKVATLKRELERSLGLGFKVSGFSTCGTVLCRPLGLSHDFSGLTKLSKLTSSSRKPRAVSQHRELHLKSRNT